MRAEGSCSSVADLPSDSYSWSFSGRWRKAEMQLPCISRALGQFLEPQGEGSRSINLLASCEEEGTMLNIWGLQGEDIFIHSAPLLVRHWRLESLSPNSSNFSLDPTWQYPRYQRRRGCPEPSTAPGTKQLGFGIQFFFFCKFRTGVQVRVFVVDLLNNNWWMMIHTDFAVSPDLSHSQRFPFLLNQSCISNVLYFCLLYSEHSETVSFSLYASLFNQSSRL